LHFAFAGGAGKFFLSLGWGEADGQEAQSEEVSQEKGKEAVAGQVN
jgi:hypothetical protein